MIDRNEMDILKILAKHPEFSQRKISNETGISLGMVNIMIKKFIKKGFVKIEGQSSKSVKYNLTPKGIQEKSKLTMEYVKISYKAVLMIVDRIKEIVKEIGGQTEIGIFKDDSEIYELVNMTLQNLGIAYKVLEKNEISNFNGIFLIWDENEVEYKNSINIFE